jgi:pimeloyl-ACP methyl ester carboxylesterase
MGIVAAMTPDTAPGPQPDPAPDTAPDPLVPVALDPSAAPRPDPDVAPEGFLVTADDGTRIHFHDWGGPARGAFGVVLVPGVLQPAWSWAPVARRLAGERRTVVVDLRGHGLSDAAADGYDLDTLAADVVVAVEGSGAIDGGAVVLAGHGFGAAVVARAAVLLGRRCAGVVLVDGGWERVEATTGLDVDEFLRGLDEPPEVLRSMDAYLGDRRDFDPATWDADQERAARDSVVETAAGRVVRAVRPHVVEAAVRTMFAYDPAVVLAAVEAPVFALVALGAGEPAAAGARLAELRRAAGARVAAGRGAIRVAGFRGVGHNLMRYRAADVAAAILAPSG